MKTRILTAAVMAAVGIPILIFSRYIIFPIALSLLSVIAVFEMLRVLGVHKSDLLTAPVYVIASAMPTLAYFFAEDYTLAFILVTAAMLFAYLLYMFFVAVFMRGALKYTQVCEIFASVTYIIISFTSFGVVRYLSNGLWNLIIILIAAWGSDSFAYFTGRIFGRHKLIPEVSPKKTVEGSVGGIICATLLMLLYGFIISRATDLTPNYIVLAVCGFVLSAVSQVGDLIASLIKREHGVKDYGNIFPGHGGVMDRFDSVLSITALLMVICILFPPFV